MALVVEDGSIVTGADSYIAAAEYSAWADKRFTSARATAPDDEAATDALIYRATDYFESQNFKGSQVYDDQPMQWPRSGVYIDGKSIASDEIPKEVKLSIYELTYAQETGNGALNAVGRAEKRTKVDVIEVEYMDNAASSTLTPSTSLAMKKLVAGGGFGSAFLEVNRA